MSQQKVSLYALSGVIRDEAFLENQLQIAGGNQSRILETLARNKNSAKNQALVVKIVYSILIGILPIVPLFTYFQLRDMLSMGPIPTDTIAFASALLLAIYFGMTFMYMFILGVISLSGFMSGEVFQWMEILPISRKRLQKVGLIVLWRFFDIPLVVAGVVFPILMTWATGNVLVCLACSAAAMMNTMFIFCILVIITEKFSRAIKGSGSNSTKANVLRVLTMLAYVIPAVLTGQLFSWAMQSIGPMIASFMATESPTMVNILLSLVPFPFAPCFLVALVLLPAGTVPLPLLGSTLIGVALLAIIIWQLYRVVLGKLRNLTSHQARVAPYSTKQPVKLADTRPITPVSPVKAFLRKDLATLSRDFQGMLYLLMPLVYPFIMFLPAISQGGDKWPSVVALFGFLFMFLVILTVMNAGMLIAGVLSIEDSGASIIASLPVVTRDQAKAKLKILCTMQVVTSLIPLLFIGSLPDALSLVPLFLSYCLLGLVILLLTFTLKVRLFGKMRYKYVLEEVNVRHKVWKWAGIIALDVVLLLGLWFLFFFMGDVLTTTAIFSIFTIGGGGGLVALLWILNRMFPKQHAHA